MTRSGRSALVEHHPGCGVLAPNFPGRVCPVVIPGIRGSPTMRPPAQIHAGSQGVAIRDVLTSPATWLDASLSAIDTATDRSRSSRVA
jgi:hypothetical protein